MSSPFLIDLDTLLAPITEAAPAGNDLRQDFSPSSAYQKIKTARNLAREAERNDLFNRSNEVADENWRQVLDLAPRIIAQQSKDLEVACWYTEALVRRHGFAGLRHAFLLLCGLVDNFWNDLFPLPDEDGVETRVRPLSGLNGEGAEGVLIAPIRNCRITEGNSSGPYTYWEYRQTVEAQRQASEKAREERIKKLGFTLDDIEKDVSESSIEFFVRLRADIQACIDALRHLGASLDTHCGAYDAPPTRTIANILEECRGAVMHLSRDKVPEEIPAPAEAEPETTAEEAQGAVAGAALAKPAGPIANRDQALAQLLEIAEYFRKAEPHSPLSYLLQKAEKWGRMPLHELMQELIPDNSALAHYHLLTGVKTDQ